MARAAKTIGCGCLLFAALHGCSSSDAPLPPRAPALVGGAAGSDIGGTGGAQTGGTGGTAATGGSLIGTGGTGGMGGATGSTGGVGGAVTGGAGGMTGGTGGMAMGGAMGGTGGSGFPNPPNADVSNYNTGERGCGSQLEGQGCAGQSNRGMTPGTATREFWANLTPPDSIAIEDITDCCRTAYPDTPSSTDQLRNGLKSHAPNAPEVPTDYGDNYGERVRGFIKAPETGLYTFWVTGDNDTFLFISTDVPMGADTSTRLGAKCVAAVDDYAPPGTFNKAGQKSQGVAMEKDKYYYFDLFHKEGGGNDHWEVRWTLPGQQNTFETVPASVLYPAEPVKGTGFACSPQRLAMCSAGTGGAAGAGGN